MVFLVAMTDTDKYEGSRRATELLEKVKARAVPRSGTSFRVGTGRFVGKREGVYRQLSGQAQKRGS